MENISTCVPRFLMLPLKRYLNATSFVTLDLHFIRDSRFTMKGFNSVTQNRYATSLVEAVKLYLFNHFAVIAK